MTQTIAAYADGTPSAADDKTTQFTYDGSGHLLTYTLLLPGSAQQQTQYVYGVSPGGFNSTTITSNDLLAAVRHPDKSTGAPSTSESDTYEYNALGEVVGFTDRTITRHAYLYDVVGRRATDALTSLGSGVNGAVQRIETTFDTAGRPFEFTSYDATAGGNVVNRPITPTSAPPWG